MLIKARWRASLIFPFYDLTVNRLSSFSIYKPYKRGTWRRVESLVNSATRYACPGIEMSNRWFAQTITRRLLHLRPCKTCWHNGKKGNLGLLRGVAFSWNESGFLMTSRAVDSSGRVTLPYNRVSDTCARTFLRLLLSPSPLSLPLSFPPQ